MNPPRGIGRCRTEILPGASVDTLGAFAGANVEPGASVITDGWSGYRCLPGLGYKHEPRSQRAACLRGEDPGKLLPAVHRVASLTRRWLLGAHQGGVQDDHLPEYLDEFAFRFNRRHSRSRGMVFYRVLELAIGHEPVRYERLRRQPAPKPTPPEQPAQRGGHPPTLDQPKAKRPWRTTPIRSTE